MVFGTVAENIKDRRSSGAAPNIFSISSRKPILSISSASSRTTALSSLISREPRLIWSQSRPGVPTTICTPFPKTRRSSRMSIPPTQEATLPPALPYSQSSSRLTCIASSRVGAITTAKGKSARGMRSASSNRVEARAKPKATVLPDPVWAETNISTPSSSGAKTAS